MKKILFKPYLLQPVMDGSKTQTRRLSGLEHINADPNLEFSHDRGDGYFCFKHADYSKGKNVMNPIIAKPKYSVGEVVYVGEAWGVGTRPHPVHGWVDGFEYKADEAGLDGHEDLPLYTNDDINWEEYESKRGDWKSPMFMPEAAARTFLKITSVRPERIKDISEEDCFAEGITPPLLHTIHYQSPHKSEQNFDSPQDAFFALVQAANKKKVDLNHYVWVYGIELVEKP